MPQNQNKISWQAPEYRHYYKSIGWYIAFSAVAILCIGFFVIIEKDIFAAVSLGILGILIIFFASQKPQIVPIELTQSSVNFGNVAFPFKQLKNFWIVNTKNHKTVNFQTTTAINNTVILELEDQNPETIREFLLPHLTEHHEDTETITQKISHLFKF